MTDYSRIRAWWSHRQALDGRLNGRPAAEILGQTGWTRSVGGANPYLALFARGAIGRQEADNALANLEIHELPSARGCTYIVPASDFALALRVGHGFGNDREMKTARSLGVTDAEIGKLCDAVLKALAKAPLDPEELREHTGSAVRNLGEAGKRKGMTSTLPLALGKLQSEGEIRRIPMNGRIDQQRYRYSRWTPNPLSRFELPAEEAYTELARRYFTWIGPATLAQFQWFSGLGVKVARAAIEPLKLAPLASGEEHLIPPDLRAEFETFKLSPKPQYVLVSSLDGMTHLRRNLRDLVAPEDLSKKVFCDKEFKQLGGLTDLYSHAILDRGRVVGLWDYDFEAQSIVWISFIGESDALRDAVRRTEEFVREDLGDARSFSLDSPKSRVPRLKALRGG